MKRKLAVILVVCLALGLLIGGCSSDKAGTPNEPQTTNDNSWNDIKEKGSFTLGLDDAFPPMGFRDEKNNVVGFDIDLANEVAKRLGVKVEFQPIVWETKVEELNGGNIDVIWNGLSITEERKKQMLFSSPYISDRQIIVVTPDSAINGKADLAGKKIGIQADSSAIEAVMADETTYEAVKNNLLEFESNDLALRDLKGGGVQAVVVDEVVGRYYIGKHPGDYKILSDNFGVEDFGVGFRMTDKAFQEKMDQVLDEMKADGTAGKISVKWFGEDIIKK
ncbi:MAG: amino acid ABC transporter substrate-binding protein [Syntrophomonadaceae bacterium]|nr:amino acid ABC transporter substrate-binding protein [Syntrophomonadaceae bacterium]